MPTLAAARPKVRFIGQVQALPLSLGSRPYISWSVSGPSLPETQRTSLHSLEGDQQRNERPLTPSLRSLTVAHNNSLSG